MLVYGVTVEVNLYFLINYHYSTWTGCAIPGRNRTNEDIRLANSPQPGSGRVEILVDDQWGTVCDVSWGLADAEVACRDLGYQGALRATGGGCKHSNHTVSIH